MSYVTDIIAILKELREVAKSAKNQPMIDLAIEIQDKVFDLKNEIESVKDENKRLQEKIIDLSKSKAIEDRFIEFKEPIFQLKDDPVKSYYCQHCWEKERKLYKVSTYYYGDSPKYECKHCKSEGFLDSKI